MPPTEKHFATSKKRTGQEYQEMHRWVDADDQATKNLRHDFTRIWMYTPEIHARFGEEGVREYIEHLREDMEGKFRKILGEPSDPLKEAFAYFGITSGGKQEALHPRLPPADLALLRQVGMVESDITHSLTVANKALEIAGRMGDIGLDLDLVARGALFHDLGKTKTHAMEHGKIGAELGSELGLPAEITAIMEKHIRGGLTAAEAIELGLPVKDYTLSRLEERIIIYADRLVDIIHDGIVDIREEGEAEVRFVEILTSYPKYGKNEITLQRYLGYHQEIQGLLAR